MTKQNIDGVESHQLYTLVGLTWTGSSKEIRPAGAYGRWREEPIGPRAGAYVAAAWSAARARDTGGDGACRSDCRR